MTTPHIEADPKDIAPLVLMPGDPLRAKFIAQTYLDDAKRVTQVRNMLATRVYLMISGSRCCLVGWACLAWRSTLPSLFKRSRPTQSS